MRVSTEVRDQLGGGSGTPSGDDAPMNYDLAVADLQSDNLRVMADSLDEVRGCLKAAIGWKSLTEGGRRDLLLRALRNADDATQTLLRLDTTIDLTEGAG